MSDKRIYELTSTNTLAAGDKLAIDKSTYDEAKSVDASVILTPISDLQTEKAPKADLANISVTGSTNNTGSTITSGTYFYKDGSLAQAKADIANGATLTLNTNYEIVTAGGLNALNEALTFKQVGTWTQNSHADINVPSDAKFFYITGTTNSGNLGQISGLFRADINKSYNIVNVYNTAIAFQVYNGKLQYIGNSTLAPNLYCEIFQVDFPIVVS